MEERDWIQIQNMSMHKLHCTKSVYHLSVVFFYHHNSVAYYVSNISIRVIFTLNSIGLVFHPRPFECKDSTSFAGVFYIKMSINNIFPILCFIMDETKQFNGNFHVHHYNAVHKHTQLIILLL